MSVLILKNIATEGPGTIGAYLEESSTGFRVVELAEGEVPPPLDGFDSLVMMGGPMGVYEEQKYPYLKAGFSAVQEALSKGKKVLGICLGAQVMAHVLGARVYRGHAQEVGWLDIELTGDGVGDRRMRGLASAPGGGGLSERFKVFHWHGDTFDLPRGAVRLARSDMYENQAFRYGTDAYALQFHIEVTPQMLREWFRGEPMAERVMADTGAYHEECDARAKKFYREFFIN